MAEPSEMARKVAFEIAAYLRPLPEEHWQEYVGVALAVLKAMREPTEPMVDVALHAFLRSGGWSDDDIARDKEREHSVYARMRNAMRAALAALLAR